jgi:hypothetical protein
MRAFLLFIFLFVGCSVKNMTPIDVSDQFWDSVIREDEPSIKKLVKKSDVKSVNFDKKIKIKRYLLKKAKISENEAIVPTTIYVKNSLTNKKGDEVGIDFDTFLVREEGKWRVDMQKTKRDLYIESAKLFSKSLTGEILKKFESFKEIFRDVVKELKR